MTGAQFKAAFIALVFALHPLNVESVAWLVERKTVLSTLFLFCAIYTYLYYVERKKTIPPFWTLISFIFQNSVNEKIFEEKVLIDNEKLFEEYTDILMRGVLNLNCKNWFKQVIIR